MRAQSQRRLIWLLNAGLVVALVGIIAWYGLEVRPAVADPDYLQPKFAVAAIADFKSRSPRDDVALRPSVTLEDLGQVDQKKFQTPRGERFHWAYSGPEPPAPPEDRPEELPRGPVEDDLAKLGRVRMLLFVPPDEGQQVAADTVVYWEFSSKEKVPLSPGDWFLEPKSAKPKSIKLVDVVRQAPSSGRYDLVYEVYDDPDGTPIKKGTYTYDSNLDLPAALEERVRIPGPAGAGGTAALPPAPSRGAVTSVGDSGPGPAAPSRSSSRELRPRIEWKGSEAYVTFDDSMADYFRDKDPDEIAKSVKTQEALDQNGRVYGLTITGISSGTPADKFDVKPGDVLISIDGKPVRSRSDAVNIVQQIDPNTSRVEVVVQRRGQNLTFIVDPRDNKTRRRAATLARGQQ